ncbi:MAG: glycosyltransferase family 4 protein [Anaerolineales bacterium]|nr:glycosyltransferase family 4 protein [Anaerolineales bacterium]
MRILYFSRDYTSHDRRFLEGLSRTEHEVFYLRLEESGGLETRPLPERIQTLQWGGDFRSDEERIHRLREILQDLDPDIVHAGPVQSCAYLAAHAGASALATMSWGSDILMDARAGAGRSKASFALERSAVFLCDCNAVRIRAIELGMPDVRIFVFPWGVDLDHFSPGNGREMRHALGWEEQFIVLSSRSFEPIYGVDTLVRGWIDAARTIDRMRLLLLGSGSQKSDIKGLLEQAGMMDRVYFTGQVGYDDLPGYLRAADLYVSASHSDGSSISLLEAMACGLPALVSDIPGNREWVVPDENGWWFPDGDDGMLALALRSAEDPDAGLPRLGQNSRAAAEERADWRRNFQRMLEAYQLAEASRSGGVR